MIEIVNVWKSFGEKKVLCGVNLKVRKGCATVIIGASGAGKTILIRHIIGLLKPDRGDVFIDGISLPSLRSRGLEKIRKQFGMVFQSGALLNSLTVGENIALPLMEHTNMSVDEIMKVVREKLKMVHLSGIEDESIANLSGGMKKRVAVARAIVRNPEIILYDEPTAGLDTVTARRVENLIGDLKERLGVTSVVVTHDIGGACRIGDRIAVLSEGEIVEVGSPEEIMKSKTPAVRRLVYGEISETSF